MSLNAKKVIWADDEINLLKPHVLFLEDNGYEVSVASSGEEAYELFKNEKHDIVLLDEMMSGIDGIETLKKIKKINPTVPVVMITKNEEEWLMDEAIASQISDYLIKPVHPKQVFLSCKKHLSSNQIKEDKIIKSFIDEYPKIKDSIVSVNDIEDWFDLMKYIINWEIKIDDLNNNSVNYFLEDLKDTANKEFCDFIESNYSELIQTNYFPNSILEKYINPVLKTDNKIALVVLDSLRYDQASVILEKLYPNFEITMSPALSFLPSSTQYSRNSIFSGLLPDEIQNRFPSEWKDMSQNESNLNKYESTFLKKHLSLSLNGKISDHYEKIIEFEHGLRFAEKVKQYKNIDMISLVVNFIDILGHSFTNSKIVKEIIPNDLYYRKEVKNWFENSWLYNTLLEFKNQKRKIFITSDHGMTIIKKPVIVKGDKNTSTGLRYKKGKNLHIAKKDGLLVKDPSDFRLPKEHDNCNYIIAKKDRFFVYPNDYNHYKKLYLNSFQHGGLSIEEIFIPVIELS